MSEQRIRLLAGMPVFGGVKNEVLAMLLERMKAVTVSKGELFFEQGEHGASAFVLEKGRVSIFKTWNDETYFLRHLEAGDCFGEVALMDFCPRSASVRADESCDALDHGPAPRRQQEPRTVRDDLYEHRTRAEPKTPRGR